MLFGSAFAGRVNTFNEKYSLEFVNIFNSDHLIIFQLSGQFFINPFLVTGIWGQVILAPGQHCMESK